MFLTDDTNYAKPKNNAAVGRYSATAVKSIQPADREWPKNMLDRIQIRLILQSLCILDV